MSEEKLEDNYPPSCCENEHNIHKCNECNSWWSTELDAWECCSDE